MIGYVKGDLLNAEGGTVLVACNGIGYEITCSASVYARLLKDNGGEVYTYIGSVAIAPPVSLSKDDEDALIALMSLGFTRAECEKALEKAKAEGITQIEKLIAFALKNIK